MHEYGNWRLSLTPESSISISNKSRRERLGLSWYLFSIRLDPWSYEALLKRQKKIGAKSRSAALRYTLRRLRD